MKHALCKLSEIMAEGSITLPLFGREIHVYEVAGRARAVANSSLHFGGPLVCREGRLVCLWHAAAFDMATGVRIEGPAAAASRLKVLSTPEADRSLYCISVSTKPAAAHPDPQGERPCNTLHQDRLGPCDDRIQATNVHRGLTKFLAETAMAAGMGNGSGLA